MKIKELSFFDLPSPSDLLQWTFSNEPYPANLLRRTFFVGPSSSNLFPRTFFGRPSLLDLFLTTFPTYFFSLLFQQSTCNPSFGQINSSCNQFRRHILWPCLTPVTSTHCVVKPMTFPTTLDLPIGLSTCLTSLMH